jgi:hypothetical protein
VNNFRLNDIPTLRLAQRNEGSLLSTWRQTGGLWASQCSESPTEVSYYRKSMCFFEKMRYLTVIKSDNKISVFKIIEPDAFCKNSKKANFTLKMEGSQERDLI